MKIILHDVGIHKLYLWLLGKGSLLYISGPQVLPAPLKNDEENNLIARIAQGDNTAREPLIVHNLRLVVT